MYTIQLNESGSRRLAVSDSMFETIEKYSLFRDLVGSAGYVTEDVLETLRQTVRALVINQEEDRKDLLDLCIDVIYNDRMKAFGLSRLMQAYADWQKTRNPEAPEVHDESPATEPHE